jgi:hypothetical protein
MATKKSEEKKTSIKSEAFADFNELRKLVEEAVDSGAKSVEQVHQAIAKMPLKYLEKIEMIGDKARGVKEAQEKTIGQMYNLLRTINSKAGDFAEEILKKVEGK